MHGVISDKISSVFSEYFVLSEFQIPFTFDLLLMNLLTFGWWEFVPFCERKLPKKWLQRNKHKRDIFCLSNSFSLQPVSSSPGLNTQYKFCGCLAGPKGQFNTGVQCSKETRNDFVQLHKIHYWHSLAFSITRSKDYNLNICIEGSN